MIRSKIIVNNSGSIGNNIVIVNSKGNKLLVDLGVEYNKILQSCNFKISDWSAALCSHR